MIRRTPLRLAALLAALGLLLAACDPQTSGTPAGGLTWSVTFDHVDNLVRGHAVRVADVVVGTVTDIRLTDDLQAEVTMVVEPDLRAPEGTVAIIRKTSLLGEDFIALIYPSGADPSTGPVLADGAQLGVGVPIASVEAVTEKAIEVLGAIGADDLSSLVDSGLEIVDGREALLRDLIADVSTITSTYAAQTDRIGAVIDGLGDVGGELAAGRVELAAAIDTMQDSTALAAAQRDRLVTGLEALDRIEAALAGGPLGETGDEFRQMLDELGPVVAELAAQDDDLVQLLEDFRDFSDRVTEAVNDKGELELYIQLFLTAGGQPLSGSNALLQLLEPA